MLAPIPLTEDMSPEALFTHATEAFRTRAKDYLCAGTPTLTPFISGADFEMITDAESDAPPESDSALGVLTDFLANDGLSKVPPPFTEQVGVRFGLDYDYPTNDPRYRRLPILRHFVEISFGVPITYDMVRQEDRARAIGTLIIEYSYELTKILGEQGIETTGQDVYEIANMYPEELEKACDKLMETTVDPVDLHEVRTLRYELSEREKTIRKSMTRAFESGTTVTMLSSITEIDGVICDDESAIPDEFSNNPRIAEHDTDLGDLFSQILAECMGEEVPKIDSTYHYVQEILTLLALSYSPYATLTAEA